MRAEQVPDLIVGGGGAGLTLRCCSQARQGVDHLLISARPGTSDMRIAELHHPPEPQTDEALAEVGRVVLRITIDRVSAVNYLPAPAN
jgi:hypothetical protein